jgi:hypothetical protein
MPRGARPGERRGGRQRGSLNKVTAEVRQAARAFLGDRRGQAQLLKKYRAGKLDPRILALFYYYAYGKPKETFDVRDTTPRPLVIDRVRNRAELVAYLESTDAEAGTDDE